MIFAQRNLSIHFTSSFVVVVVVQSSPSINLTINTKRAKNRRKRRRTLNTHTRFGCCCCFSLCIFTCESTQNPICIDTIFYKKNFIFTFFSNSIHIYRLCDKFVIDKIKSPKMNTKQRKSNEKC